ncbi:OmpA family protein [Tamlana sp. 2_MG-2023]|uniref:OmpA family protein n=1 Tax=unclassified Tamlana TaxID=2614803 RepID=UPI0026E1E529|nr:MULTISPECIES: OmpA family protein [unclassified Tamlana]MDO6760278.1 OmpA family protein [Tamlana sp. 2_MG-2023]MDO6790024.1 OmpA family protein [Tamlana sp. 1_MG-2023]
MKKIYFLSLLMLVMGSLSDVSAQSSGESKEGGWFFGLGYNFVDDSGTAGSEPFNFDDNWHYTAYPNRLNIGYKLGSSGFAIQAIGTINTLQEGKKLDGYYPVLSEDKDYWAVDGMISYSLNKFTPRQGWFDPYLQVGMGGSSIADNRVVTFNAGAGANFWIGKSKNWAINLNTMGKWGINKDDKGENHIQHAIGVVFKPGIFKKKKPEPAPVVEKEPEPEPEPVVEATPVVEPTPEPKVDEEAILREQMASDLSEVRRVYYDFDSSTLTSDDQDIVDELVVFMNKYPTAVLDIKSHADSRGAKDYNLQLSQKRSKSIVDYAVTHGIDRSRFQADGFGETQLNNGCSDGVKCTREEHRENRRTDYELIWE